jgi:hypothetical protein
MEWSGSHSSSYYIALAVGLVAVLLLAWRFATVPTARSVLLLGLRSAVLIVLFVILLEPVRVTATRLPQPPPSAVYLVDCSRSMGLETPTNRFNQARRTIASADALLALEDRPRIDIYGFGRDVTAYDDVRKLRADADETRLHDALVQLSARLTDTPPNGVIVFSDGRSTDNAQLDRMAEAYRQADVPIHVVAVGDPQSAGDVAIESLVVPREVRSGMKVPVRVVVRSRGFDGERAELLVRGAGARPGSRPLASLPLSLIDGEVHGELTIDAEQAVGPLVVEVPPLRNEAVLENNRVPFQVGRKDPKIRVIYMEGTATESHWLREALIEDPNIECLAMEVDEQSSNTPRLHRVDDPALGYPATREELFSYDVVICSDINRGAFTPEQLAWTVELVNQRGGGFAMVGGYTSFGAGRWDETSWDGMIPVDMSRTPSGVAGTIDNVALEVQIPPEMEVHPIWHIVDDPVKNRDVLARMPIFYGTNLTDRLKPAAMLLGLGSITARNISRPSNGLPYRKSNRGAAAPGEPTIPVFSCQSYGRGRTLAFSSDTTYGWGSDFEHFWGEGDNRYYRKFWRNVVTWLAENSTNANRRLEVETDKFLYRPGEPVRLTARAFDERLEPTQSYRLVASFQGLEEPPANAAPSRESAMLSPRPAPGLYQAELAVPRLTRWPPSVGSEAVRKLIVRVEAFDSERVVARSEIEAQVIDDSPEYRDVRPDRGALEALARKSGGRMLQSPQALADLLRSYRAGTAKVIVHKSPLWDRPAVLLTLLVLLTAEWVVRRTKGLA